MSHDDGENSTIGCRMTLWTAGSTFFANDFGSLQVSPSSLLTE